MTPIVYLKAAVSLEAIYDTNYTQRMVAALLPACQTVNGYKDGVDENGKVLASLGDKTNEMILAASEYALNSNS